MLLRFTDDREIAGVIRDKQNWIGGNDYNPVVNEKRWGRVWEAGELLQLVADFERRVSTTRA